MADDNQNKHEQLKDNVLKKLLTPTGNMETFSKEQDDYPSDYPADYPTASQEKKSSPLSAEKMSPQLKGEQEILMKSHTFKSNDPPSTSQVYNSYRQFNPAQYEENSPEWQIAMLHYLIDMKKHGHKLQEASENAVRI